MWKTSKCQACFCNSKVISTEFKLQLPFSVMIEYYKLHCYYYTKQFFEIGHRLIYTTFDWIRKINSVTCKYKNYKIFIFLRIKLPFISYISHWGNLLLLGAKSTDWGDVSDETFLIWRQNLSSFSFLSTAKRRKKLASHQNTPHVRIDITCFQIYIRSLPKFPRFYHDLRSDQQLHPMAKV